MPRPQLQSVRPPSRSHTTDATSNPPSNTPNSSKSEIRARRPDSPLPPISIAHARRYPDAPLWAKEYDKEFSRLQSKGVFKWVPRDAIPPQGILRHPAISFRYTYTSTGAVKDRKVRISYPGNRTSPYIHYNLEPLATYSPGKGSIRIFIALATQRSLYLNHIDLEAAVASAKCTSRP